VIWRSAERGDRAGTWTAKTHLWPSFISLNIDFFDEKKTFTRFSPDLFTIPQHCRRHGWIKHVDSAQKSHGSFRNRLP
jgi:hypothetical protein